MSLRSWRVWAGYETAESLAAAYRKRYPNARFSAAYLRLIERDARVGSEAAWTRLAKILVEHGCPSCYLQIQSTEPPGMRSSNG